MFIRTEEEIYDTERTHDLEIKDNELYQTIAWLDRNPFLLGTIVKQAETIEELCDEFVYIKHIDDKTFHYFYNNINTTTNELYCSDGILHYKPREDLEIYGAIWTNKGLIYVSKVNEKGELELL